MKSIVVLSGKGGVGKSSISASLALVLSKDKKVICADCDVDASNLSLLFSLTEDKYVEWKSISTNQIAIVDKDRCINCGKCIDSCYFHAIKFSNDIPIVNEFGCEGCGACEIVCPKNAIRLENIDNAFIGYAETKYGFKIVSAQLLPGNSGSGKVVSEVRKKVVDISNDSDYLIIDSAAGIGCPVIASVTGNDYALIVTEPTPSGFSDMKRALEVVYHFRVKRGIVINKYNLNDNYCRKIEDYAKENNIKIIAKIPFDKQFVNSMVSMIPIVDYDKNYLGIFEDIKNSIIEEMN